MSYQALYRAWRPRIFEEVIGQTHITETIKNQIRTGNVAHAYLFCGTRGTGKTSTAKILARAINCLQPNGEDPCNECEICQGMLDESLMDIIEIDAASNNGVDDIRELRENVKYPPSRAKFKVYIVDEVHMLSQGAFNALLKTLEEPPSYVVFILATTEPHKIPATILSRCQRFDFKRISGEAMVAHLERICLDKGVTADHAALRLIVRNADGAMRDALSILDQCTAFTDGTLSIGDVVKTLGMTTEHWLFKITDGVLDRNAAAVMKMVDELVREGKDIQQFIRSLTNHYRSLMLAKSGAELEYLLDSTDDAIAEIRTQAERCSMTAILRGLEILSALEASSKWATQPRIHLEMGLVKLIQPEVDQSTDALLQRIEALESGVVVQRGVSRESARAVGVKPDVKVKQAPVAKAETGASVKHSIPKEPAVVKPEKNSDTPAQTPAETIAPQENIPVPSDLTIEQVKELWPQVLEGVRKHKVSVKGFLIEAEPAYIDGNTLMLSFQDGYGFHMDMIERPEHREIVEQVLQMVVGCSFRVKCEYAHNLTIKGQEEETVQQSPEEELKEFLGEHADKLEIVD